MSLFSIMSIFSGFMTLQLFFVWDSDYLHTLRLLYIIELSSSACSQNHSGLYFMPVAEQQIL